nr:hypothetical protein [Verrucomicrobium spinosum]
MKRFDCQFHPGLFCCREDGGDAVRDLATRLGEGLPGDGTADQDDQRGTQRVGFVDGPKIVVDGRLSAGGGVAGKESAAAQLMISSPAPLRFWPAFAMSWPARCCRQTVMPPTPAAG